MSIPQPDDGPASAESAPASRARAAGQCLSCVYFRNDAGFVEAAFGGLTSLSSGFASVRADDGICLRHDRYLSARSSCADFSPRA